MARRLLKDTCPLAAEILDGQHDADLTYLQDAIAYRLKSMFRKGAKVRLVGTKNPTIDGKVGTVLKVNPKRISVGLGDPEVEYGITFYPDGEYNVPPTMLQAVTD